MCSVENCVNKVNARGYCSNHYRAWRTYGDPLHKSEKYLASLVKVCTVDECENPKKAKGLCAKHKLRMDRYGTLTLPEKQFKKKTCRVEENGVRCGKPHQARLMCQMHYRRWATYGDPSVVKQQYGISRPERYKMLYKPGHPNANSGGMIAQHRFVYSEFLGRPLLAHENIHHINGDRRDNRLENLELWSKSQPSGQRVTDKVEWAIELLKQYAPEKLRSE